MKMRFIFWANRRESLHGEHVRFEMKIIKNNLVKFDFNINEVKSFQKKNKINFYNSIVI